MITKTANFISKIFLILVFGIIVGAIILSYLGVFNTNVELTDNSSQYVITDYTFDATVKQNNTIDVEEKITAQFLVSGKHGIFRAVPEVSEMKLINEQDEVVVDKKLRLSYSLQYSNTPYQTESESGFLYIQLGSENQTYAIGESDQFIIRYTITLDSRYPDYNLFYFNTLGNYWDTTISNYSATIAFEDAILTPDTKIYIGQYGSTDQITNYTWNTEKTELSFSKTSLAVGEGITVKVDLPANYATAPFAHTMDIIMLAVIILSGIAIFVLYRKGSNKKMIIPVVQFSVDKKFTSADVGYIVDKKVDNKDIASLIILWAQKGYLEIIEDKKKTYIRKTKDADKFMKTYEKNLFEAIFSGRKDEKVDIKSIGEKIVDTVAGAKLQIVEENSELFNKKASLYRGLIIGIMSFVLGATLFLINMQNVNGVFEVLSVFAGLITFLFLFSLSANRDKSYITSGKSKFFNIFVFITFLALILLICILSYDAYCDILFTAFFVFAELCVAVYCIYNFNIRTDEGVDELGDIVGLKNFIEVAEKDRLEMLAKENPQIFYEVMPYAYVLGIYDTWCKKFEDIAIDAPTFYHSTNSATLFNVLYFNALINSTFSSIMNTINTAQIAKIAEKASQNTIGGGTGGFGGGGFSGGGIGGGGGGSWWLPHPVLYKLFYFKILYNKSKNIWLFFLS